MNRIVIFFGIIILSSLHSIAQESKFNISNVEQMDEDLIGNRLKKGIKLLGLDSNFRVIHEPLGIYRGIRSEEINGWQVQLIVKKTLLNRKIRSKGSYEGLKNKRIIGVSWVSNDDCESVGNVIPHYAYNRFGPCD